MVKSMETFQTKSFQKKNCGYFSAGCAKKPPIAGPIIKPIPREVLTIDNAKAWYSSWQTSEAYVRIVPSRLLKHPRRNLEEIAIQKDELSPNIVLKMNTENVPISIIGFLPYLSASTPQNREVKALPIMNEEPTNPA